MPQTEAASLDATQSQYRGDQLLVERLLRGDAEAWRLFVDTHGRLVRARVADVASAFGRSRDESAIDDATAEVFAALLGNDAAALRAFAGRSSLGTYIAVIATRSATRGFARRHPLNSTQQDPELAQQACQPQGGDPVNELISEEQRQQLRGLVGRLPDKQRHVVSQYHLQGKTYAEISRDLQMPIGSIGPTLRRAEEKLRHWLECE